MKQQELDAIKCLLAEEFGLTGIDDPDELRLLLQAKLSEMNALDRAAFQMRLGRILKALESGKHQATGGYTFLGFVVLAMIGWFIWRPLAAVLAIFAASNFRSLVIRHSLFWSPQTALTIGGMYGSALAILVKVAALFTVHSVLGEIVLGALGLLAAGYIGHSIVPIKAYLRMPRDEKRLIAQIAAIGGYSIAIVVLFVGPLLLTSK